MTKPQTIQIFLPDGSPTSIREAEITNRLVKAILFPRNKLDDVAKRDAVHYTGVYFLFGTDEDDSKPLVYIGEGEDCFKRIQDHNRKKDFWTYCVVLTTKTNEYTKTDVKYLEHYCLGQAEKIGRFKTENGKDSQRPSVPETREHDLLDNFDTIKILLATLGYPLFEDVRKAKSEKELFYCKGKEAFAEAELIDEGILVHKGGKCTVEESKTSGPWVIGIRSRLLEAGVLVQEGNLYVFTSDHIFPSYSAAAACVLARRANGWTEWKNKDGKTLDELKRK
jgi:hypothetical protein